MTYKIACGDVMPGCSARFEETDRDRLMAQVAAHAQEAHGLSDLSPEAREAIESRIVTVG